MRLRLTRADLDADPLVAQCGHPPPVDQRVRVEHGNNDTPRAGGDERRHARRGAALMDAGLERDVHVSASRRVPGAPQSVDLRMRLAGAAVRADGHRRAVAGDDTAHHGVRASSETS